MGSIRKSLLKSNDTQINMPQHPRDLQNYKVFRMTSIMVAGFSFTMLPYGIVCMMFYSTKIDCSSHTIPYTLITLLRLATI